MRLYAISACIFLALVGLVSAIGFFILVEPGTNGRLAYLTSAGKIFLYKHAVIDELSDRDAQILYRSNCTRKCHSTDVIETKPRTAVEWEWIVARMNSPERADMSQSAARGITEYLQRHFLSNVPTILPERTMRFLRRNLWKSDFGVDDIYFDLIYIPTMHTALMPYLVAGRTINVNSGSQESAGLNFVLYINTHQGTVPPLDLTHITTIRDGNGGVWHADNWQLIYED